MTSLRTLPLFEPPFREDFGMIGGKIDSGGPSIFVENPSITISAFSLERAARYFPRKLRFDLAPS